MSRIKSEWEHSAAKDSLNAQIYTGAQWCLLHRFSRIMASWSSQLDFCVSSDVISSVKTTKLCLPSQVCLDLQNWTVKVKTVKTCNAKRRLCKSVLPSSGPTLPKAIRHSCDSYINILIHMLTLTSKSSALSLSDGVK